MFRDRKDAGIQLASKMLVFKNSSPVIFAVPRGGVPVALELAKALKAPMDIILVKKLGHPLNKEFSIGAVSQDDYYLIPHDDVSPDYVRMETANIRKRLNEMSKKYPGTARLNEIQNKTVVIVDDGVATGNTLMAAIPIVKKSNPARVIIAVPIISDSARRKLQAAGAEVVAISDVPSLGSIGQFYLDFSQITDEEVISIMGEYSTKLNNEPSPKRI
jgi:putative phosphoribosyl transferase